MHMTFSHHGRQFFFLTFALKGRPKLLSRIVEVEGAAKHGARGEAPSLVRSYDVALTPWGEAIIDEWKGQHGQNQALTASSRVVMPDHCHLLLIVNYDIDPCFDILDWLHHFRRAVEARWAGLADEGRGSAPRPVWEDAFWLDLSFDARQLAAIRHYIRMNPARAAWKAAHPDRFKVRCFSHSALPAGHHWHGLGDATLLANPFLLHVRLTTKLTVEQHAAAIDAIVAQAERGWVIVSGFISPGEVEVFRRLVASRRARLVKFVPYALETKFDPSVVESRLLSEDRLVILSGFDKSVERGEAISRANCLHMNDLAAEFCAGKVGEKGGA